MDFKNETDRDENDFLRITIILAEKRTNTSSAIIDGKTQTIHKSVAEHEESLW